MTTEPIRPARRRKPSPQAVIAVSVTLFFGTFGFLTLQLSRGGDPALGARAASRPDATGATRLAVPPGSGLAGSGAATKPAPVVTASS